jgi:hypothetical protein
MNAAPKNVLMGLQRAFRKGAIKGTLAGRGIRSDVYHDVGVASFWPLGKAFVRWLLL